jgi:uncharacterized membrane protein (UPF0127 family)
MSYLQKGKTIPLFESYCKRNDIDGKEILANISGIKLKLRVASTPESQMKGYMHHESGPKNNSGLLFVYDQPQPLSFWMKNVKFPLDIIFFDDSMNYIGHETMDPAQEAPDEQIPQYHSKKPARFAVELEAGWCEKNMRPNCKLSF